MDFFQAQENARKKTGRLVLLYIAAVIGIIVVIYAVVALGLGYAQSRESGSHSSSHWQGQGYDNATANAYANAYNNNAPAFEPWQPVLLAETALAVIVVIGLGSLFKTMSLRSGGGVVAQSLGGELVAPNTSDPQRRRLLNVVEEMSIAAGIRMPAVYVLPEQGINAFAAGYSPDDAAVAVSQGALDALTRDELQGVIGHEFSHILNGDMRLNIKLIGLLFGILMLTIVGRILLRATFFSGGRRSNNRGGGAAFIALLGLVVIIVGYIGVFFGHLIQAAVSRQREFLADASSVQFTRNPDGITGALKKIGLAETGSLIANPHATETSHMFFASALRNNISGLYATHPPLAARIKAIDPTFDGDFRSAGKVTARYAQQQQQQASSASASQPASTRATPPPLPTMMPGIKSGAFLAALGALGAPDPQHGASILEAIPEPLKEAAHDPERARAILLALLYDRENAAAAAKQDAVIARTLTPNERTVLIDACRQIEQMPSWTRLSLGDIALSSARHLDDPQTDALFGAVDDFIAANGEVSLYEYALRKVIHRNLRPPGNPGKLIKTCDALAAEISIVLSTLAHAGASAAAAIQHAFDIGAEQIRSTEQLATPNIPLALVDPDTLKRDALINALDRLDTATPAVKQGVLSALASTASADGVIEPAEQELLRAVSAALNCPAPVLMQAQL